MGIEPAGDEKKIRELIADWHSASAAGDVPRLLNMMADDVVFLVPGHPPMRGRENFAASFRMFLDRFRLESHYQIEEIRVCGEMAYSWVHLTIYMAPVATGTPRKRSGYAMSVLRKEPSGAWVFARDANLGTDEH